MSGARRPMPAVADLVRPRPPRDVEALDPELWCRMSHDERVEALRRVALDFHERLKIIERDARTEF